MLTPEWQVPDQGIVVLDFSTSVRPPGISYPIEKYEMELLSQEIKKVLVSGTDKDLVDAIRWESTKDRITRSAHNSEDEDEDEDEDGDSSGEEDGPPRRSLSRSSHFKSNVLRQTTTLDSLETELDQRGQLQCSEGDHDLLGPRFFDCEQVNDILQLCSGRSPALCAEVAAILWPRLVDEENQHLAWNSLESTGKRLFRNKVGCLKLFNPFMPNGFYELDLSCRGQHIVAQMLVQLAVLEPGNNILNEYYGKNVDSQRPFNTPKIWLTEMETFGVWSLTYHCEIGQESWGLRRKLAEKYLGWHFGPGDFDGQGYPCTLRRP